MGEGPGGGGEGGGPLRISWMPVLSVCSTACGNCAALLEVVAVML